MSRRAHTPPREAFDWPGFLRTLPLQPATIWFASALALRPLARATPVLLRATCQGPLRQGVVNSALIVYSLVLPEAAAALVYLLAGRRRMSKPHRLMGDWCLALILLIAAFNASDMIGRTRAGWRTLRPGLSALRAACWK